MTLRKRAANAVGILASVAALAVLPTLSGCSLFEDDDDLELDDDWSSFVAWEPGEKLGGCAIGDIDPDVDGNEIVVVTGETKRVVCLHREGDGFVEDVVATLPGEMIQVAVGDVVASNPGDEIVAVGIAQGLESDPGPGVVNIYWRTDAGWQSRELLRDEALVHGVSIDSESHTIAAVGYTKTLWRIRFDGAEIEKMETPLQPLIDTPIGNCKGVAFAGDSMLVACEDGKLLVVDPSGDGSAYLRLKSDDALARVAHAEDHILVCDNGGRLFRGMLGSDAAMEVIHDSSDRLRGAVLADLDPEDEGLEVATAGYDGRILVFEELDTDEREMEVAAIDAGRFHHLTSGTLADYGTVLVGCGYGGRVLVVWNSEEDDD